MSELDDAITKVRRLRREAQQMQQPELERKLKRILSELESIEYQLQQVKRQLP